MARRKIEKIVHGSSTRDGAGVKLTRVLANRTVEDFDPFLMLDFFDSYDPEDYTAGFPMHPHRGIETITYLIHGRIEHEDSLGNRGVINSGESQWMTAGEGILHQEMPKKSEHMLGFQLWLNLPQAEKMTQPKYLSITPDMIAQVKLEDSLVRVLSGEFEGKRGVVPHHIQASIYDVELIAGSSIEIPTKPDENVFVFLIEGDAVIEGKRISQASAVLFGEGEHIEVTAAPEEDLRFAFFSGRALHEPVAWGGPIVMNTQEELKTAFDELRAGTFIKHG